MNSIIVAVLMLNSFALAAADQVKVQSDGAVLRKDKRSASPAVAQLQKGQTLDVLQRDKDWLMAESSGKRGWAHETWLKEQKAGMASGLRKVEGGLTGDAQAAAARDAAAGKGVTEVTRQIATQKGYSQATIDQLDNLMKIRTQVIDSGAFESFAKEGNVGPADMRG